MRPTPVTLALLLPLLAGCLGGVDSEAGDRDGDGAPAGTLRVEAVAGGLEIPWAMAFAPDGRILVTERWRGEVRVIDPAAGGLQEEPLATFAVAAQGEAGLMGLALHPDFAEGEDWVYVMYTHGPGERTLMNRISRFRASEGAASEEVLVDGILGATFHDGGRLAFGPDGKLYATTGDAGVTALSQAPQSLNGKVLRMEPDGTVPADNPVPGSLVYTLGHRNPQGIAWDAEGRMWATEHGPSGIDGPGGYDEVNLLNAGGNYGWPARYCTTDRAGVSVPPGVTDPVACHTDAVAPAGIAVLPEGHPYPDWNAGDLFYGTLRGNHLHRLVPGEEPGEVAEDEALFQDTYGRIRDVAAGPDGLLYFTTSNRDGRGDPRDGDDHVWRMVE